ncbi:MAG: hypothetical protein U1F35_01370 [Steroidobacteraceae bacterium]
MATRTVRFDEETEKILQEVRAATGWPISEVLKRGLHAVQVLLRQEAVQSPYDVYDELDLGPGGYAIASSANSREGVKAALKRKLGR